LSSARTESVLAEEHFEQIANPSLLRLLREGMTKRQLGLHLVHVPPADSVANHVAVLNELREDPMRAAFRDPHGLGDIA
jgi:hypothetical protein